MALPRSTLFAAALLAMAFAIGCGSKPVPPGAWRLALSTAPADPAILSDTQFQLRVASASGQPVDGAAATVDLVMATMDMGPNRVALQPLGHGLYAGAGHFAMAGDWNCTVTVTLGARAQSQTFHYKVG